MYDIPQIFTEGKGGPNNSVYTVMMYINNLMNPSKQYGLAGAVSVVIFIITVILSVFMFRAMNADQIKENKELRRVQRRLKYEKK